MLNYEYDSAILNKIRESVNMDDLLIYLKPITNNFGSAGAASMIARLDDAELIDMEDSITESNKFALSRFWLEVVAMVPGYLEIDEDGNKDFKLFEEDDWCGYEEYLELPIGCVTGYVIDKKDFSIGKEDDDVRSNLAIKFDCISQILSDFWNVIDHGALSDLIGDYDDHVCEDEKRVMYYLDDIYYKKGFEDVKIDRAVVKLLGTAVGDYLGKELDEIVYEPFRADLFEPYGFVDTDKNGYIERAKMLAKEDFKLVRETRFNFRGGLDYYVKSVNDYNIIDGEEIVVEFDE